MDLVAAAAIVLAGMEFIKKALGKFGVVVEGLLAVVFTILFCVGVTIYKWITENITPVAAITFLIQLIIYTKGGYELIKKAGGILPK